MFFGLFTSERRPELATRDSKENLNKILVKIVLLVWLCLDAFALKNIFYIRKCSPSVTVLRSSSIPLCMSDNVKIHRVFEPENIFCDITYIWYKYHGLEICLLIRQLIKIICVIQEKSSSGYFLNKLQPTHLGSLFLFELPYLDRRFFI